MLIIEQGKQYLSLKETNQVSVLKNYGLIANDKGIITHIDESCKLQKMMTNGQISFDQVIDCSNFIVMPGMVDAHSHALFAGDRSFEFAMKIKGQSYAQIRAKGFGIGYTTNQINKSSIQSLIEHLDFYIQKIIASGTTTIEIKSGYGLNAVAEVKMLQAIEQVKIKNQHLITIISTFCGAHSIPQGKTELQQTHDVIFQQIPAVQKAMKENKISPVFIDVFCEKGFFSCESSRQILQAGANIGLIPSFHGDQLSNMQSGILAKQVKARAVSHIEYLSQASMIAMAEDKIVGVLLPTTQHVQKLPIPAINKMREHGLIVGLGSDFCPNAFCYNMFLVAHLACTNYKLTAEQAFAACTLNSAYSLCVSDKVGSLACGKWADIVILQAPTWLHFVYSFGFPNIRAVIKKGQIAYSSLKFP